MANSEHVELLRQGHAVWNQWRKEHADVVPNLEDADLRDVDLRRADLSGANLYRANLFDSVLYKANLCGTKLQSARLTQCRFTNALIDERTNLRDVEFGQSHDPQLDRATRIKFARRRHRVLDWAKIRAIGTWPLFGVSYTALVASLLVINGIAFLNEHQPLETLDYPLPLPERAVHLLISSLLLAVGSSIFKGLCPSPVRRYSETEWLFELGHSVLLYRSETVQRWWAQVATLLFVVPGGLLATYLIFERLAVALAYIMAAPIT